MSAESYDGAHDVAATPKLGDQQVLRVAATGRVTRLACTAGSVLMAGSSPLSVDGEPVVALATSEPLFRDLKVGDSGADVRGVQKELARLGYDVSVTGRYDAATGAAVKALLSAARTAGASTSLPVASVLWLPSARVVVASCDVQAGDWVSSGTQVAKLTGALGSLTLADSPGQGWVARYGDHAAPVGKDGTVTDAKFLAAVEAGPELAVLQANPDSGSLQLQVALAKARQVLVVPSSAVVAVSAEAGCVLAGDSSVPVDVPVDIVASTLGQTMVAPTDGSAPRSVVVRPGVGVVCS